QMLSGMFTDEEVANVLVQMHDLNEFSRASHDVMIPVIKSIKSAAGLFYALLTEAGHLPEPGLNVILSKSDAPVYVEKYKGLILEWIFTEFNEYEPSKERACVIFRRFPVTGVFGTLFTQEKDRLSCLNAMMTILKNKSIPNELTPHVSEL